MDSTSTPKPYNKTKTLVCASVGVFAVVAVVCVAGWFFVRKPHFDGKQPASVEMIVQTLESSNAPASVLTHITITNEAACERIFAALRKGRFRRDHACTPAGTINITYPDGKTNQVMLLPDHRTEQSEFRLGVLKYKVNRDELYEALQSAGVGTTKIPEAKH